MPPPTPSTRLQFPRANVTTFARRYKKHLKHLHLVHPSFMMKVATWFFQTFVSGKFWSKVRQQHVLVGIPSHVPWLPTSISQQRACAVCDPLRFRDTVRASVRVRTPATRYILFTRVHVLVYRSLRSDCDRVGTEWVDAYNRTLFGRPPRPPPAPAKKTSKKGKGKQKLLSQHAADGL
jgi:hypothetical protein